MIGVTSTELQTQPRNLNSDSDSGRFRHGGFDLQTSYHITGIFQPEAQYRFNLLKVNNFTIREEKYAKRTMSCQTLKKNCFK